MQSEYKSLKKFKVLVGTPHADVKNYCLPDYILSVDMLTYKNKKVLVVDNSATNKNKKLIEQLGVGSVHLKRGNKSTRQLMAEASNYLRDVVLKNDYDFLLHFESDIIPPPNVIERLLSHQKQVVSAAYHIGFGINSHLMIQEMVKNSIIEPKTSNVAAGADGKYMDGKLHHVFAAGLGMTLIHRSVLENIEFRWDANVDMHPDTFFAVDLHYAGIKQYVDTSIYCHHNNSSWGEVENK